MQNDTLCGCQHLMRSKNAMHPRMSNNSQEIDVAWQVYKLSTASYETIFVYFHFAVVRIRCVSFDVMKSWIFPIEECAQCTIALVMILLFPNFICIELRGRTSKIGRWACEFETHTHTHQRSLRLIWPWFIGNPGAMGLQPYILQYMRWYAYSNAQKNVELS